MSKKVDFVKNPLTGRYIKKNGQTYNYLVKCGMIFDKDKSVKDLRDYDSDDSQKEPEPPKEEKKSNNLPLTDEQIEKMSDDELIRFYYDMLKKEDPNYIEVDSE